MAPFPPPGGVLALDLGGVVGWCYGHLRGARPTFGHWVCKLEGELEGERYLRLSNVLWETFDRLKPDRLIIERALRAGAMHNDFAMNQQIGMRAIALAEAARCQLAIPHFFTTDLIRHEMLGRMRFKKGKAKEAVLAWVRREGYVVANDNEADAIILWRYWVDAQRRGLGINPALLWEDAE